MIEAVFEEMDLKKRVFADLDRVAKVGAVLATNTSTLDVDVLAQATGRPQDVLGTHFFSPANVMRLLEVVRGAATAPDVLATVMKLAGSIGKVAVVSGVCYGFIGNRMAEVYMREAEFLMMEGAEPAQIDGAVERVETLGMAMGPCRMLDMAGVDVGAKTVIEYGKAGGCRRTRAIARWFASCSRSAASARRAERATTATTAGRRSPIRRWRRSRARWRTLTASAPVARRRSGDLRAPALSAHQRGHPDPRRRHRLPAGRHRCRLGRGLRLPRHRGGPMFLADEIGWPDRRALAHYAEARGNPFGYWTPSPLLTRLAASGEPLASWVRRAPSSSTSGNAS